MLKKSQSLFIFILFLNLESFSQDFTRLECVISITKNDEKINYSNLYTYLYKGNLVLDSSWAGIDGYFSIIIYDFINEKDSLFFKIKYNDSFLLDEKKDHLKIPLNKLDENVFTTDFIYKVSLISTFQFTKKQYKKYIRIKNMAPRKEEIKAINLD